MNAQVSAAPQDWTLSVQVFLYLQVLDTLTTWLGFRAGLAEASPLSSSDASRPFLRDCSIQTGGVHVRRGFCVWRGRFHVIQWINYWYAALVSGTSP